MKRTAKFLTREEERTASADILVTAHKPLVANMARNFARYGAEVEDLIQEGNIGLMMAAERFDRSLDVRFATYAQFWVRQKMREYVVQFIRPVRVPASTKNLKEFFSGKRLHDLSLDAKSGREDTHSLGDVMPSLLPGPDVLVEEMIDGERTAKAIGEAMAMFHPRTADIIFSRYFKDDRETLDVIGERHRISKERVRQIETKALEDIRKRIER